MTFQGWVEQVIRTRYRTATALAESIGMELSPFTRGVKAGTLNLVNLLKLARAAEEHPSTVLRLAGKAAEADLIEELYGSGHDALPRSHRELIEMWERLTPEQRAPLFSLARELVAAPTHGPSSERTPAVRTTSARERRRLARGTSGRA